MFEDRKPQSPINFLKKNENYQVSPISKIENDINGITRFAILKTTDHGKWLRGNMLFYELDGVSVYTESTNIIFVNLETKTMFIRDNDRVANEINPSDPEEKQYILLYTDIGYENSDEEFPLRWEAVSGRTNAYENIKINAPIIDIDKSLVLVETVAFKDSLTVRQFVEYLKNANIIDDSTFDVNDYSGSDYL